MEKEKYTKGLIEAFKYAVDNFDSAMLYYDKSFVEQLILTVKYKGVQKTGLNLEQSEKFKSLVDEMEGSK